MKRLNPKIYALNYLRGLALAFFSILPSAPLIGDALYFKDGRKLEGEIIAQAFDSVRFKTEDGVTHVFRKDLLKRMTYESKADRQARRQRETELARKRAQQLEIERKARQERQWDAEIKTLSELQSRYVEQIRDYQKSRLPTRIKNTQVLIDIYKSYEVETQKINSTIEKAMNALKTLETLDAELEQQEAQKDKLNKPQQIALLKQTNQKLENLLKVASSADDELVEGNAVFLKEGLEAKQRFNQKKDLKDRVVLLQGQLEQQLHSARIDLRQLSDQINTARQKLLRNPEIETAQGPLHQKISQAQKLLQELSQKREDLQDKAHALSKQEAAPDVENQLKEMTAQLPDIVKLATDENKKLKEAMSGFDQRVAENEKNQGEQVVVRPHANTGFFQTPLGRSLNPLDSYAGYSFQNRFLNGFLIGAKSSALLYWMDWQTARIYTFQRTALNPYTFGTTGNPFPGLSEDSRIVLGLTGLTAYREAQSPVMYELLGQSHRRAEKHLAEQRLLSTGLTLLVFAADYGLGRYFGSGQSDPSRVSDSKRPQFWFGLGQGQVQAGILMNWE